MRKKLINVMMRNMDIFNMSTKQYVLLSAITLFVFALFYCFENRMRAEYRAECNAFAAGNSYVQYMDGDGGKGDKVISELGALSYETLYTSCMRSKGVRADQF